MSRDDLVLFALVTLAGMGIVAGVGFYAARRRAWILPVLVLSLPAVVSALLHLLFSAFIPYEPGDPGLLRGLLYWVCVGSGMLGIFFTPGALLVALVGTWRSTVPARARVAMWSSVVPSLLALVYLILYLRP